MSPRYTPKVFLRQAPNRLLHSDSATNILIGARSPCLRIWRAFLLN